MRWLLKKLDVTLSGPTPLFCDKQAARHITNNPVFHERTKDVKMDCYFIRERVTSHEIQPSRITTKMQIAKLLTQLFCLTSWALETYTLQHEKYWN